MTFKRYLKVLRNLAFLATVGMWRSVSQLRMEARKAADAGFNLHVLIMTGGLGDMIAAEPTIRAIIHSHEYVVMLARSTSLLDFDPSIDATIRVDAYLQALLLKRLFSAARWTNLHFDGYRCNMFRIAVANPNSAGISAETVFDNRTLADAYSLAVVGTPAGDRPRVYPDPLFDVDAFLSRSFTSADRPLLVFHSQATEAVRSWPVPHSRKAMALLQAGTEMNILELGLDPVLEPSGRVFQPRKLVTLSQEFAIFRHATAFLGVNSGYVHAATAIGLPCVLLLAPYKGFAVHLPCSIQPDDTIVRSPHRMEDISPEQAVSALMQLTARLASRRKLR